MSDIHVLAAVKPSPLLAPQLNAAYTLHECLHETDPAAFAAVAPLVRGV